ncbi:MAG: hypothetical protein JXB32_23240 [Deltaproteobacteria bacterium]|nr:hypothetical protein [Deltaproteobacteria bacterium]
MRRGWVLVLSLVPVSTPGVACHASHAADADAAGPDAADADTPSPDDAVVDSFDDGTPFDADGDAPFDTDGGTLLDSDGDTISDDDEGSADRDGDTLPNRFDTDSDDDGWSDAEEAGDALLDTPPVDTDGDTTPDFLDLDSDDDGLSDFDEATFVCTERTNPDTDGDGCADGVEVAIGSDPCAPESTCRLDYIFIVPYEAPPEPASHTIPSRTFWWYADVHLLMDVSGTMADELAALRAGFSSILVPATRAEIPDTRFGLGSFSDYPVAPFGAATDSAFLPVAPITDAVTTVQTALESLALGDGGDDGGSHAAALWTLATQDPSRILPAVTLPSCPGSAPAGVHPCRRTDAVPLVALFTDRPFHDGFAGGAPYGGPVGGVVPPTFTEASAELAAAGIRVLGFDTSGATADAARPDLEALAGSTRAVTDDGTPLVATVEADGTGLAATFVDLVRTFARDVPVEVRLTLEDDPFDGVDTVAAFVDHLELDLSGASLWDPAAGSFVVCTAGLSAADRDGDGHVDAVEDLLPGTTVCGALVARTNTTVPAMREPQLFRATLRATFEGRYPVDERDVYFLVPPELSEW